MIVKFLLALVQIVSLVFSGVAILNSWNPLVQWIIVMATVLLWGTINYWQGLDHEHKSCWEMLSGDWEDEEKSEDCFADKPWTEEDKRRLAECLQTKDKLPFGWCPTQDIITLEGFIMVLNKCGLAIKIVKKEEEQNNDRDNDG